MKEIQDTVDEMMADGYNPYPRIKIVEIEEDWVKTDRGVYVSEEEYDPTYKHNYCYGCSKLQALNEKGGE